ncbi:hypothetical protein QCM77_39840 [Bradyrhizobium sp. SSUT18]|uniref:hypothetical protein n=1 Tax=unclassified Bradyrhizobium TaxID=2631580 RepID=UPI00244C24A3|nr:MULTISPECIES: hypothetical protein [unclassified Bradyrhizobium]MDH2347612.1 hypothetical protein [Bradyrhizobium sp. SSUT77]MDH2349243.1 hypothetical protein [Bradyrhizobium sp. SSUT112]MDH2406006.1 hypothetical protein [Bradyrhizobium sp. SSUT18]
MEASNAAAAYVVVTHHRAEFWRVAVLEILDIEHVLGADGDVVTGAMIERNLRGQETELGGRIGSLQYSDAVVLIRQSNLERDRHQA